MGPAVRAAAADAKRQIIEIAAQRHHVEERVLDIKDGMVVSSDGNVSTSLESLLVILESAQILGKGGRGPNPTGMSVLTFGIQVVEVAVDVETGEVRVDRVYAAHDVGRIVNTLGARSQVEGGIIQGIGHTLSEQRLLDPETGRVLTTTLDAYRMPTIADVPEIVCEFVDEPADSVAYGPRELSPSETSTRSSGKPSSSAAICAIAVRVPVPMSCIAVTTVARPSEPTRTQA
jgi:CO/xanthine dehydrogenase Mo-binding subunit